MGPALDSVDLFCRINVQAEIPFQDFVAAVARCASGSSHMNVVRTRALDISVFENDDYDADMSHTGKDRWLHFRYRLEIDPIEGASPTDYVAAIGALLNSLWSFRMDAVAACEFEDRLPRNVRRLKWAWNPRDHGTAAGSPTFGGAEITIVPTAEPVVVLDACARIIRRYWTQARFEDPATGKKYHSYQDIPFGRVEELLAYRNSQAEAAWDADSPDAPPNSMLHLIRSTQAVTAVVDDPKAADMAAMLASLVPIRDVFRMEPTTAVGLALADLNPFAEAA